MPRRTVFVDSRLLVQGTEVRSTVCVIGAGIAGLAIATELERAHIDTVVLESGGLGPDEATADLYRGENVGLPYVFADGSRYRYFGGSSNGWAGYSRPMAPIDFMARAWVPDSGWPIDERDLQPHVVRAHNHLGLDPFDYSLADWVARNGRNDVKRIPFRSNSQIEDILTRFSVPPNCGRRFRGSMESARHVRVHIYANVVELVLDTESDRLRHVSVKTLSGKQFTVRAEHFVLACGGIENARLMLASNRQVPQGLGNRYDLVGRFFADHPWLPVGRLQYVPQYRHNRLYDRMHQNKSKAVSVDGHYFGAQFALTQETQQREQLLNAHVNVASIFRGAGSHAAAAWMHLSRRFKGLPEASSSLMAELRTLAMTPAAAATFALARRLRLFGDVHLEVVCEPSPNRNSRVLLSTRRDRLGMPRVKVDWQMDELVKKTIDRTALIVAEELRMAGAGDVELFKPLVGNDWPQVPPAAWRNLGSWHHMGTTRMHESRSLGVVDRNCRVHDVANLYVAGSSVFPTYGANFPTMTIVALALRLSDHLGRLCRQTSTRSQ
jgi:choline dehydrogenase-like flavoprotein